ncbi:MAG: response regulator transcription factor [Synergistaceae bacterium]|nr:response regulator transcription factor [Synergistaceae bacterium]MBQ7168782.1 response regulator transcription factor [Synergistaceae bacterium]MBR0035562.1 response regulator transcription factor [Synergistaceae bacterium]
MDLNIAVVDDTLPDIVRLENFVRSWFYGREHKLAGIASYANGEEMLKGFEPGMFQIVFMDIIMESINGIQTARQLRAEDAGLLIVFMTASREYAFDAFPIHPFDYVLKPYSKKDVGKVLDEAVRALTADDPTVTIKASHSEYTIPTRMISSVVSRNHNVEINLSDGRCILSAMTFTEAEKLFAGDSRFLSCNRGIILNMSQISAQEKGVFVMKDGTRYPIRVHGQSKVTAAFSQYLISSMRSAKLPAGG